MDLKPLRKASSHIDVHLLRVPFKDVVCYLSLLEAGRPEDKLECKTFLHLILFGLIVTQKSVHFCDSSYIIIIGTIIFLYSAVVFRLYDTDSNGYLDSNVSLFSFSIVSQHIIYIGIEFNAYSYD